MGTVYVARQEAVGRDVAVKVLRHDLAEDPEMVERFGREARAASRLSHPNIVTVHDFGCTDDGYLYTVMELVDGESLKECIAREGAFPVDRALRVARDLCEALAAAHAAGVVHRDLKPENILLARMGDRSDVVKVLDFGIAKLAEAAAVCGPTGDGALLGTPMYMAPEYIQGHAPDHRADLYAAGVVLYEMLSGHPPFRSENPTTVLLAQLREELPPLDVEPPLSLFLERALAKEPAERFQTAVEMRETLEALRRGAPSPTAALSPPIVCRRRAPMIWALVGAVSVAALAVVWTAVSWEEAPVPEAIPPVPPPPAAGPGGPTAATVTPTAGSTVVPPVRPAPRKVVMRLRSKPTGAAVLQAGEVIATTPADYEMPRGSQPLLLRFRKRGFAERVVEVVPRESGVVEARLLPLRRAAKVEPNGDRTPAGPHAVKPTPKPKAEPKPKRKIYEMEFEH
jgi:serine/threonine-protein kinase